jgi:hypothetical protein
MASIPLLAQSKGAKEAQKFKTEGENVRKGIEKTRDQFKTTMNTYNSFLEGKDKKLESGYKKLSQDVTKSEKMVEDLRKQITGLEKTAEGFFATWEQELKSFTSESIRKQSEERLNAAKTGFETMRDHMSAAGEAYQPFIGSLKDQIQLLGLDLSPDTLAALQKESAPELNQMADELFKRIDDILNKEKASHDQVDQALDEKSQESPGVGDVAGGDIEEDSPGEGTTEEQSDSSN